MPGSRGDGVSVVVAHYGDDTPVRRLLDDLSNQVTTRSLQVIVVDDRSPSPFTDPPEGVQVVRRQRNGGYGAAINSGARFATEPLLLIMNSDITLAPGFVEELVTAAGPHLPCVAGPATVEAGSFLLTGRRFPTAWRHGLEALTPLRRWLEHPAYQRLIGRDLRCQPGRLVSEVDWLQGSVLLFPTRAFLEVGGFDERFFMYSEEIDLQRRLRGRGVPVTYLGSVSVGHDGGMSSDPAHRTNWLVRSQLTYAHKWGFERRLRWTLLVVAHLNLVWNTLRLILGREASPRSAYRRERYLAQLPLWPARVHVELEQGAPS